MATKAVNVYFWCVKFGITVRIEGRNVRLQVEMISQSNQLEKYEIKARNKSLTIQSNRPLLRGKGIKYRRPDYKLIAGTLQSAGALNAIIDVLHEHLRFEERGGNISGVERNRHK